MEKKQIHIGEEIKKILNENDKNIIGVGKKLFTNPEKIYRVLKQPYMDCEMIRKISVIIDVDICSHLKELEKKQEEKNKEDEK
jgi:hypothetical protein